jgi:predicted Rossmann fold nucleotide-binding protein DprA/Smf involved in DNA uptake
MVKEGQRLLKLVSDGLKFLAQGVEAIAEKMDDCAKTKSTGKAEPDKQPVPEKTDKTVDLKPKTAQSATPKVDRKKAVKPATATGTVLDIISRSPEGVSTATIRAQTGYEQKKVSGIVYKLRKQGKIKAVKKGVYVKS